MLAGKPMQLVVEVLKSNVLQEFIQ